MAQQSQPKVQLACPICSTFNPADFRFCPHCGHMLGAPPIVEKHAIQRPSRGRLSRTLVLILFLVAGVEAGLLTLLWQRTRIQDAAHGSAAGERTKTATSKPAAQADKATLRPTGQPVRASVTLTLLDREGDILRQARGTLSDSGYHVVTTFESIHGAYSGTVRMRDDTIRPISAVERADPTENRAVLALDSTPSPSPSPPLTLEALARATYEETSIEARYLAEKRARAEHWEEAIAHWKRAIELDPSLRQAIEAAVGDAFLKWRAAALTDGRPTEAHARLLDAVAWLPERGDLRLHLAESFSTRGEYREAIEQYGTALDLLPSQAGDITAAIVRVYRDWGHGFLRQGEFTAAANAFREALLLDSSNGELYFALGKAEFRRRAFYAAVQAFEAAQVYEPGLRSEVQSYLTKAQALLGGPATAVIDFPPGSTRIGVSVVIDGRVQVPFIIDTGAAVTLMPAWAGEILGYRAQPTTEWIRVQTAGGLRSFPYATVSRFELQGLSVSNLPVIIGDLPGSDVSKGLLGMDFLRHFSLAVDHEIGRMTLRLK